MSEKNDDIKHDAALTQDDASQANSNNFDSSENSFQSKTFNDQNDTGLLPAELSKAGLDAVSSLSGSMAALTQNADYQNELANEVQNEDLTVSSLDLPSENTEPEAVPAYLSNSQNSVQNDYAESTGSFVAPEAISKSFGTEIEPETFVNTSPVVGNAQNEDDLIPASLIPSSADQDVLGEDKTALLAAASTTTAGALLKQARENANVSELSLAAQLKVSVKTLRALEADELHLLPGVAFARSLVTSICRTIKVDATEILALMPKLPQAKSEASQPRGLNLPMSGSSIDVADTFAGVGIRVLAALIVIGIAIIVVINWTSASSSISSLSSSMSASEATSTTTTEPTNAIIPTVVASLPTETASPVASSATPSSTTSAATTATTAASAVAPVPVKPADVKPTVVASVATAPVAKVETPVAKTTATTASTPTPSASAVVAQAGQAVIVFKLTETSYLEVSEIGGKQLLGKNGVKDDEVTVVAKMPVKVKVGNATSTTVIVNGQIYNTAPYSKGNVARFELK